MYPCNLESSISLERCVHASVGSRLESSCKQGSALTHSDGPEARLVNSPGYSKKPDCSPDTPQPDFDPNTPRQRTETKYGRNPISMEDAGQGSAAVVLDCTAPVGGCTVLEASSSRCRAC